MGSGEVRKQALTKNDVQLGTFCQNTTPIKLGGEISWMRERYPHPLPCYKRPLLWERAFPLTCVKFSSFVTKYKPIANKCVWDFTFYWILGSVSCE
jgi:hypothetical protein